VRDASEPSARRRVWTSNQKLQVIAQIDLLKKNGADVGTFIRKKVIYSSKVSLCRKQRNEGLLEVEGKKRGPKAKVTPEMLENQRLQRESEIRSKSLYRGVFLRAVSTRYRILATQNATAERRQVARA
jgi:hypothetical protein